MDEDDPEEIRAHEAVWKKLYDAVDAVFSDLMQQGLINERDYFVVEARVSSRGISQSGF